MRRLLARQSPNEQIEIDVYSSHFARQLRRDVTLHWGLSGIDSLGWAHDRLCTGSKAISFPQYRVELAERIRLSLPNRTMLCTLWVRAMTADGSLLARNYIQFFVERRFSSPRGNSVRSSLSCQGRRMDRSGMEREKHQPRGSSVPACLLRRRPRLFCMAISCASRRRSKRLENNRALRSVFSPRGSRRKRIPSRILPASKCFSTACLSIVAYCRTILMIPRER